MPSESSRGSIFQPDELEVFSSVLATMPQDTRLWTPDNYLPSDDDILPTLRFVAGDVLEGIAETMLVKANPDYQRNKAIGFPDLRIRTKARGNVIFSPNPVQEMYLDQILPEWRHTLAIGRPLQMRGLRQFILKPRQLGLSTLILAMFFIDTVNTPNTQTVVIADNGSNTTRLFQMVRRFYRNLPAHKRPRLEYNSRTEMSFPDIDSVFYVGTAGAGTFGRGGTTQNVHCSEVAFWPNAEEIVAGLMESVPQDGNVFVESTANGYGGWFDREYFDAKRGESGFKPIFFPWTIAPEYSTKAPEDFVPDEKEQLIQDTHGASNDQLYWRRTKLLTLKGKFAQEYPLTDMEAFLTTGIPYFDREALGVLYQAMQADRESFAPLEKIHVPLAMTTYRELFRELIHLNSEGVPALRVYEPPVPNRTYVIGADVAEGDEQDSKRDFDAAPVLCCETLEVVAVLHGHWTPSDYAILLSQLAHWYNRALLGPERNNHGHSTINTLLNGRPGYEEWMMQERTPGRGGLYFMEDVVEREREFSQIVRRSKPRVNKPKPGWLTNKQTRPIMLDTLDEMIRDGSLTLNDEALVSELMTFVKKSGGKSGGEGDSHDDLVIGLAIACVIQKTMMRYSEKTSRPEAGLTAGAGSRFQGLTR